MEERIEVRVPPETVWQAWERAHENKLQEGIQGKSSFRYQILNVKKGESFSILWKTMFVRLLFSHAVRPMRSGSQILYKVEIRGLFAWPVRWLIGGKIRNNLRLVLQARVRQLENLR